MILSQIIWKQKISDLDYYSKVYYVNENTLSQNFKDFISFHNEKIFINECDKANEIFKEIIEIYLKNIPNVDIKINKQYVITVSTSPTYPILEEITDEENTIDNIEENDYDASDMYLQGYNIGENGTNEDIFRKSSTEIDINFTTGILDGIIASDINNRFLTGFLKQNKDLHLKDIIQLAIEHAIFLNKKNNVDILMKYLICDKQTKQNLINESFQYLKEKKCPYSKMILNF